MDYGILSVEEIERGYKLDGETGAYTCNFCGKAFPQDQVFPVDDAYLMAEAAVKAHIATEHGGAFSQNLEAEAKYNSFTDTQKKLMGLLRQGLSDRDIAKELGTAASTVRHQKFTFREKAKQAKHYLAVYNAVFSEGGKTRKADDIMAIPNSATMMDNRYVITEKERDHMLSVDFESLSPLKLREYPLKAKRQVAVLSRISEEFERGRRYSREEVRDMLTPIYEDYNLLQRYLVDYGFMNRTKDGAEYWRE